MRSEKEIKSKIKEISTINENFAVEKESQDNFNKFKQLLEWTLEGPPRYSIEDLEKILKEFYKEIKQIKPTAENSYCDYSHAQITLEVKRFLQILKKNPKKVEEILNVRKKKS